MSAGFNLLDGSLGEDAGFGVLMVEEIAEKGEA